MPTPSLLFKITDVGLAHAQNAVDMGIKIKLTTFKLGSSFGYVPSGTETNLAGSILYSDPITSYKNMPDGSLVLVCSVDVQAGPFDFGEIGIYNEFGELFALATLPQLQTKYTSLGSNVNSTFTFNCHMRLSQSVGIFEISAIDIPACELFVQWKDIKPPIDMDDPRVTRLIVSDLDSQGNVSALVQTPNGTWSIQSNLTCLEPAATVVTSDVSYIEVSDSMWQRMFPGPIAGTIADLANDTIVVEMVGSQYRVATPSISGVNVRLTFTDDLTAALSLPNNVSVWCNNNRRVVGVHGINGNYTIVSGNGTADRPLVWDIDLVALAAALDALPAPVGSPVGSPVGKVGSPVG